jgi:transposase
MEEKVLNLNRATYIGIDAHTTEHTAVAINRFEEEKGTWRFNNSRDGIANFMNWLRKINPNTKETVVGIEGAGNTGHLLTSVLTSKYEHLYEVNPLYTKQRREYGTKADKSDKIDAKLIAEVLTRKLDRLPKITSNMTSVSFLRLKKLVWFYEDLSQERGKIRNHLHGLLRDWRLSQSKEQETTLNLIIQEKKKDLARIILLQKRLKDDLKKLLSPYDTRLTTLKGVSTVLAARLVVHTKGIERFRNINKFIQYAGIAPTEKSSGLSKKHHLNKRGNRLLNATIYLVAINQLRWNEQARIYFQKKIKEGKTKRHAIKCLMKRVACIIYGVMKKSKREQQHLRRL